MSSKIVLYKGKRGCGKTLTMVKDGFKYYLNGWKVLRNFDCRFGDYIGEEEILSLNKHSELYDCVIMIDELQIFFDSRQSMRKNHISFSNFIQQVRKRNIIILTTTQYSNTIDLRFRQHVDIVAYPNYIKELNICEVIYIDMTMFQDAEIQIMQLTNTTIPEVKLVFNAEPIFKLYNSYEMIK